MIVFFYKSSFWRRFISAMALVLFSSLPGHGDERTRSIINCDIQNGPCAQMIAGHQVTLEISPRPVMAMQDLTFTVTIGRPVDRAARPYIDLNMPAMDMGKNRVPLKRQGEGVFEGRGVIVRCISDVRTWQAKITLPGIGRAYFIFDVVY